MVRAVIDVRVKQQIEQGLLGIVLGPVVLAITLRLLQPSN
jgi:hypothetical protein